MENSIPMMDKVESSTTKMIFDYIAEKMRIDYKKEECK